MVHPLQEVVVVQALQAAVVVEPPCQAGVAAEAQEAGIPQVALQVPVVWEDPVDWAAPVGRTLLMWLLTA